MKLKIMVDSSSGITQEEAIKLGIDVFPLRIIFDDKEYLDGIDIMQDEFYEKLTKEGIFPKTSLPNLYEIEKKVKAYIQDGYSVIILPLSKEISGTYSALVSMMEDYENVRVIDTLTTICGLRFLVNEAIQLKVDTLDELEIKLRDLQKRIRIVAGIDTLEYLYKGGRLTKTSRPTRSPSATRCASITCSTTPSRSFPSSARPRPTRLPTKFRTTRRSARRSSVPARATRSPSRRRSAF